MPKLQATFLEQMQAYQKQKNILPAKISLIWIGSDIPNTSERPYLENAVKHKRRSPQSTVRIFVNEKMLRASNKWDGLIATCKEHGIELRDIEKSCSTYINYDLVMKLMKRPKDYVWASDILRLSLMYHEGGKYFDTDITPKMCDASRAEEESASEHLPFGINLYYPAERGGQVPEPGYLAGVPLHFFYFYSSMLARYLYDCVQAEIAKSPATLTWLESRYAVVRQMAICELSGCCTSQLIFRTSLSDLYGDPIVDCRWKDEDKYTVKHDHTWLEGLIDFEKSDVHESEKAESDAQIDACRRFMSQVREQISDDESFVRMGEMYNRQCLERAAEASNKALELLRELEKHLNKLRDSVSELNQQGYIEAAIAAKELHQAIELRYKSLLSPDMTKEEKMQLFQQCKKAINEARPRLETHPVGKLILKYFWVTLTGIGALYALTDVIYTLTTGEHLMFFKTPCAKEAVNLNDIMTGMEPHIN